MGRASVFELVRDACDKLYPLCYCEAWNLESFQGILEAAEEEQSPIIVGFNGGFLKSPERAVPENLAYYAGLGQALSQVSVPVGFLLNESEDLEQLKEAAALGFNGLMIENGSLELQAYRKMVREVVSLVHPKSIWVEAQMGRLPHREFPGEVTDAREAAHFARTTGVDALGISIGNIHILTEGKAAINLDLLEEIRQHVRIPLVVHGGTGFPEELAGEAVKRGVVKFNFGTLLKQAYLAALGEKLSRYREPMNPHRFVGVGGKDDIMRAGREAVKEKVRFLLRTYGSAGKAAERALGPTS